MSLLSLWISLGLTSATSVCLEADRLLLSELGFSAPTAEKLCVDRLNMRKIRRVATKNREAARAVKVYRGIAIDPKNYVPNRDLSFRGVFVDKLAWRAPISYSTGGFGVLQPDLKIGTLIEFEVPEYVLTPRKGTYIFQEYEFPRGAKDFPLYTTRIAEVDVAQAIRAKSGGTLYTELTECEIPGALGSLFGTPRILKWKNL